MDGPWRGWLNGQELFNAASLNISGDFQPVIIFNNTNWWVGRNRNCLSDGEWRPADSVWFGHKVFWTPGVVTRLFVFHLKLRPLIGVIRKTGADQSCSQSTWKPESVQNSNLAKFTRYNALKSLPSPITATSLKVWLQAQLKHSELMSTTLALSCYIHRCWVG